MMPLFTTILSVSAKFSPALARRLDSALFACAMQDECRDRLYGVDAMMPFDIAVHFVGSFMDLSPRGWAFVECFFPEPSPSVLPEQIV